jgi:hypothetical protein
MNDLELYEQFKDLNFRFPKLSLQKDEKGHWSVQGLLKFTAEYNGYRINDEYLIKVDIPDEYPDKIPEVQEIGNRIPQDFHHYQDGSLCLGARLAVKQKFRHKATLAGYVDNCLIPYLYSFSYKSKFGKMPFGELAHGGKGILEYYKDLFKVSDSRRVLKLLDILREDKYRGHDRCPCGTGKRLRSCHGDTLLKLQRLQSPADFQSDFLLIIRHLVEMPTLYTLKTLIDFPHSARILLRYNFRSHSR